MSDKEEGPMYSAARLGVASDLGACPAEVHVVTARRLQAGERDGVEIGAEPPAGATIGLA